MDIDFTCVTNKNYVMINAAVFEYQGVEFTVDRKITRYSVENGNLNMCWQSCYLWSIDGVSCMAEEALFSSDAEKLFRRMKFVRFELEDDADENYSVELIGWNCDE